VLFRSRFWSRYLRANNRATSWERRLPSVIQGLLVLSIVTLNFAAGTDVGKRWLFLLRPFSSQDNADKVQTALLLRDVTTADATVAVVWAGAEPYFMGRQAIDLLGKSDRRIAHEDMRYAIRRWHNLIPYPRFYPGHLKYDYAYSIGQLRPDVVAELWENPEEAEPYLHESYRKVKLYGDRAGYSVFLRKDSPYILWERVNQLSRPAAGFLIGPGVGGAGSGTTVLKSPNSTRYATSPLPRLALARDGD